jgi:hypothetical protein
MLLRLPVEVILQILNSQIPEYTLKDVDWCLVLQVCGGASGKELAIIFHSKAHVLSTGLRSALINYLYDLNL